MSLGRIIASTEIIVSVWGSLKLAGSLGKPRWDIKIAKVLFYLAVIFWIGVLIANLHWAKFSDMLLIISSIYLLLVILVFYRMDILKTAIIHLLYWFSIIMFQATYLFIICYVHSVTMSEYVSEIDGIFYPYYSFHIVGLCTEIICVYLFGRAIKNRNILIDCSEWFYVVCIGILVCEVLIDFFLLGKDMAYKEIDRYILSFVFFFMWTLATSSCIAAIVFKYIQTKHHQNQLDMNMKLFNEQYEFMVQSYEDNNCQIHDTIHRDIMLLGMLENHQYEKAVAYLKERTKKQKTRICRYTGLTTIDIMLSHKIETSEHYHIHFNVIADIYDYPLEDNHMCVLIGNLLDNSIEAVKKLPKKQRQIEVLFKSANEIFILEVVNPYAGDLKKKTTIILQQKKKTDSCME